MKINKIGFFGISTYGLNIFKHLIESDYEIIFATLKSKPMAHVDKLQKEYIALCKKYNIPMLGSVDVNNKETVALAKNTDLCIIGGYDKILKSEILNAPTLGIINTHFGIIPENRGCNPVMWAIIDNITQGATTYWVNENIDYGKVIDTLSRPDLTNVTAKEAYDSITEDCTNRFPYILQKIEEGYLEREMDSEGIYHKAGIPNQGYLSLDWDKEKIKRYSDALWFPPYKPAKIKDTDKFIRIIDVKNNKITCEIFDEDTNF